MSMYSKVHLPSPSEGPAIIGLSLVERNIYGSSRIGTENPNQLIARSDISLVNEFDYIQTVGDKRYELSNHLGNVLQVVTDRKLQIETTIGSGVLDYYSADVVSQSDYYPFGATLSNTNFYVDPVTGLDVGIAEENDYRYGFGSHEKDDEVKGNGNHLSFGDMGYDPRTGRRWRPDPFEKLYAPISPYSYALNSPIMFTDSDGNVVIGTDGKPVTYERGEDGVIKWSENATADVIEVGNAMLSTEFGEKSFNKWQNADTKITIDRETAPENGAYAETKPTLADDGYGKVNKDGQYEEAEIIFYDKNIEKNRAEGSGQRFEGASREETLGAVGTHEVYHNEKKQINLDIRQPEELKQSPGKNLPINAERNFRKEYHENNSEEKNAGTWEQNYEQRGYEGIEE